MLWATDKALKSRLRCENKSACFPQSIFPNSFQKCRITTNSLCSQEKRMTLYFYFFLHVVPMLATRDIRLKRPRPPVEAPPGQPLYKRHPG